MATEMMAAAEPRRFARVRSGLRVPRAIESVANSVPQWRGPYLRYPGLRIFALLAVDERAAPVRSLPLRAGQSELVP